MTTIIDSILRGLLVFFNITSTPQIPSPDWIVRNDWHKDKYGNYSILLESDKIPKLCEVDPSLNLYVPVVIQSTTRLIADQKYNLYQIGDWNLKSVSVYFEVPQIPCSLIVDKKIIQIEIKTPLKFWARIISWPELKRWSMRAFVSQEAGIIALGVLLGVIIYLLGSYTLLSENKIYRYQLTSAILHLFNTLIYHPGKFGFSIPVNQVCLLLNLSLWWALSFTVSNIQIISGQKPKLNFFLIASTTLCLLFCLSTQDYATQFFTCLPIACIFYFSFVKTFYFFSKRAWKQKNKNTTAFIQLMLIIVLLLGGTFDLLFIFGLHDLFFTITLTSALAQIPMLFLIHEKVESSKKHLAKISEDSQLTQRGFDKAKKIIATQEKIIHDIKNPLTALKFILAEKTILDNSIPTVIKRLESLTEEIKTAEDHRININNKQKLNQIIENSINEADSYSKALNIKTIFKVNNFMPEHFQYPLTETELSRVLLNCFYNSIENTSGDKQTIFFALNQVSNNFLITIKDTNDGNHNTEKDYQNYYRGIGQRVIKEIIQNCNGLVDFVQNKDQYEVNIQF